MCIRDSIISVPLADESDMRIGYIVHRKAILSRLGNTYLGALAHYLSAGSDESDDSVKIPQRKLQHRESAKRTEARSRS